MPTEIITIKDCLFDYVKIILQFEEALTDTYNLTENPYRCKSLFFPKTGTVKTADKTFVYRFHGGGCSFEIGGIEVHYNYYIPEPNYIVTEPWKFWRFVATYLPKKDMTKDVIAGILKKLSDEKILRKMYPDYLVYQIDFSWFKTYIPAH
jgi:hypothetical protein